MSYSIFLDHTIEPDDGAFAKALGEAKPLYDELAAYLTERCGEITRVWKCTVRKYGWSQRLIHKKRTILYTIPQARKFLVAFVFGDRAVRAALESALPDAVKDSIQAAKKHAEGTGFRLEVCPGDDIGHLKLLIDIKLEY